MNITIIRVALLFVELQVRSLSTREITHKTISPTCLELQMAFLTIIVSNSNSLFLSILMQKANKNKMIVQVLAKTINSHSDSHHK